MLYNFVHMNPISIDVSAFRSNLASVTNGAQKGKVYLVKKNNIPILEIRKPSEAILRESDPWDEAIGGWKDLMTDKEAQKLIKNIYKWRKDGSSSKKNLWK